MKYHVLNGDDHREVRVDRGADGLLVEIDGRTHAVDVRTLRDGAAYSLLVDGRSVDVSVEEDGDRLELLIGGRRYSTTVLGEREYIARSIKGEDADGVGTVAADMTGIVRDVLVAEGDAVVKGQTLLILEAMKMENEIKASTDGSVARVAVEIGTTVSLGDLLVEIE